MIVTIVTVVWLAIAILAVRPALQRQMLKQVCADCGYAWTCPVACPEHSRRGYYGEGRGGYKQGNRVVRGAKFERDPYDVLLALWLAAWWPVWVVIRLVKALWRGMGFATRAAGRSIAEAVPLTGPELDRRIKEQSAEIERLTDEINRK